MKESYCVRKSTDFGNVQTFATNGPFSFLGAMRSFNLLFVFSSCITCARADVSTFTSDDAYDAAAYGEFPVKTYMSTDIVSPKLNVLQSSPECDDALLTFITPRGFSVSDPSATILDQYGHLVWSLGGYQQIYNLMVQEYLGKQYLTFWAGNDAVGGHGAGYYYMVWNLCG